MEESKKPSKDKKKKKDSDDSFSESSDDSDSDFEQKLALKAQQRKNDKGRRHGIHKMQIILSEPIYSYVLNIGNVTAKS